MRRHLTRAALIALHFLFAGARAAHSQSTSGTDAGVFLLLPTGAQAVGMGQAVVAADGGSESVWWNPAALGSLEKRELAVFYGHTVAGSTDVLAFAAPSKHRGSLALSLNVFDPGPQQVTDDQGQLLGTLLPRDLILAGTYAFHFARGLNVGATFKLVQFRVDCTGQCTTAGTFVNSSKAADAGIQYRSRADAPLAFGLAVRNFGGKVKAGDTGASDDLPTRTDAGFQYHVVALDKYLKDTQVIGAASVVATRGESGAAFRAGADVVYKNDIHFRAGYVEDRKRDDSSASLGFGIKSGSLIFDIARSFGGLSADAGVPPTYISLRYLF